MSPTRTATLLLIALAATLVTTTLWRHSYDDAYITYRYAQNYATGNGLVFNPGERVLGTTAPGWAFALGLASRFLPLDPAAWGTLLSALALAWLSLALFRPSPAFSLLFAALAFTLPWNLQLLGAEGFPIVALAVTAALLALPPDPDDARPVAAGVLMAAAMALRLDAALAATAVGVALWVRGRRLPWRYGVGGLLPLAAWLALLWAKFGTVLPNTLAGKRSEGGASAGSGIPHWLGYTRAEWSWLHRELPAAAALWLLALAAAGAVLLVLALRRRADLRARHLPLVAALAAWVVAHEVIYRAVGVPFAPWYHLPTVAALLALAAWAAWAAREETRRWLAGRPVLAFAAAALLLAPIVVPGAGWLAAHRDRAPDARTALYADVGRHLAAVSRPGDVVAAVEIGALAYTSDRPVLDLMGLVDPAALEARVNGELPQHVAWRSPRYLVTAPHFMQGLLGPVVEELRPRYRPVATFSSPRYQGGAVTLWETRTPRVSARPSSPR
ncbi:MAG TPA: hypothetical protein VKU40_10230 [Thermoanaerobaculia bacterium]|nr:hypothetical protein [Thermoanaerobaculia bacterium]